MSHINGLSEAQLERLSMLAEECGEVVQAINKIIRHGYDSHHPDGGPNNRALLSKEIGDIEAVVSMMRDSDDSDIPYLSLTDLCDIKTRKMKYTHYQE